MLDTIMMTFKLTCRNWLWLWHVRMLRFTSIIKILFKANWWFWYRFVPNLLSTSVQKIYLKSTWQMAG